MGRIFNFSAGPAMLPEEVLKEAAADMMDYHGCGMSVMEMSHRSKVYQQIIDEAEADLRKLIGIPDNYKVLFMQGGATLGFAMIPMNFMFNAGFQVPWDVMLKASVLQSLYPLPRIVACTVASLTVALKSPTRIEGIFPYS